MLIFDVNHSSSAAQKGWALLDLIERQGVSVIPVKDKRPLVKSWREFQTRTIRQEVAGWLRQWPDADFALLTGKRSWSTLIPKKRNLSQRVICHRLP